ncbi:MAG: deoxynucleoside kinase [Bacteroidales bacterium]|nr:deoxynucleoside kinase [Bacteroidales bacterium]
MQLYVIEGNIGAGKTLLTKLLAEKYNAKAVYEQFADNPFLPKFYKEPDRYAFPLELSFLADRYNQLKKELAPDSADSLIISDYYFSKSLVFARKTLTDDEYNLYFKLFNLILNQLPKPTIYVYLHRSTSELLKNIKKRGRDYEKSITADYLKSIEEGYFDYLSQQTEFPVLIFECDKLDFENNREHLDFIDENIFCKHHEKGVKTISNVCSERSRSKQ